MNVDLEQKIVDLNTELTSMRERLRYSDLYHSWTKGYLKAYAEKYPCPNCGGSIWSHAATCSFSDMLPTIGSDSWVPAKDVT